MKEKSIQKQVRLFLNERKWFIHDFKSLQYLLKIGGDEFLKRKGFREYLGIVIYSILHIFKKVSSSISH